jgi:hypothetical protein
LGIMVPFWVGSCGCVKCMPCGRFLNVNVEVVGGASYLSAPESSSQVNSVAMNCLTSSLNLTVFLVLGRRATIPEIPGRGVVRVAFDVCSDIRLDEIGTASMSAVLWSSNCWASITAADRFSREEVPNTTTDTLLCLLIGLWLRKVSDEVATVSGRVIEPEMELRGRV